MPLLTVPNWSLGRERSVLREAFDFLSSAPVKVHFAEADIDHNRTVTAFSGTPANVQSTLLALADIFLPCINLQRHTGVHPRIGGLDVCPFIPLPELWLGTREANSGDAKATFSQPWPGIREANSGKEDPQVTPLPPLEELRDSAGQPPPQNWGGIKGGVDENKSDTGETSDQFENLNNFINETAQLLAESHNIPIFLYEHSAPGRSLPNLRKGGFGGLLSRELHPDFGPNQAHPHLGATVLGWRDFLVALNVNFPNSENAPVTMRHIADQIRDKRRKGDPLFAGVRALGLELQAQEIAQLSMNITQPNTADFDAIISYIEEQAGKAGINDGYAQLIGVIRDTDIERSTKIYAAVDQVIQTRIATTWQEDWPENP